MSILIRDIKKYYRYIIYAAKADLQSEVTNAYLDWFWWILEPVCNMLIYYLIFGVVFKNEEQYYLVFIYSGITMWTFFSRTMTVSVRLIQHSKSIITKVGSFVGKDAGERIQNVNFMGNRSGINDSLSNSGGLSFALADSDFVCFLYVYIWVWMYFDALWGIYG